MGLLIGPSVGLQSARGTLFFWLLSRDFGYLLFSRDHGASWAASHRSAVGGECSIAFAHGDSTNETIVSNCRSGRDHRRAIYYWRPDGLGSYVAANTSIYPPQLTDPGCQGSLVNAGGATLYASNAASTHSRSRMTVSRSVDGGATWGDGVLVHAGPSAYSQLVVMGDRLGLLFEAGTRSPYETISFVALDLSAHAPTEAMAPAAQDGTSDADGTAAAPTPGAVSRAAVVEDAASARRRTERQGAARVTPARRPD